ncbi:MAG: FtsX-like permease family protein [Candidatus Lokiarchaeota archaeon]|nr:FtsX-like permease family protein [Candidatus Lokiarchaeota archaeon]
MKTRDTLGFSFGAIKLRKVRSALTTLGIVIGIAAIVALLSFTEGFQVAITNQFQEGFSTDTVIVSAGNNGGMIGFGGSGDSSDFVLYNNDTEIINEVEGVSKSAASVSKTTTFEFEDGSIPLSLTGVDFEIYADLYSTFAVAHGEIPDNPGNSSTIIGHTIYDPYNNGTHLVDIGDTVNVFYMTRNGTELVPVNLSLTVVGVLEKIGSIGFGPSDTGIYIPIDSALDYFNTEEVTSIAVKLENDDEEFINQVIERIEDLYEGEVSVTSPTAILDTLSSVLNTVENLLAGIAGISLVVAGVGIMNIMIVSLMERTREIGILKALGAKGRTVLAVFLAEALLIGVIGGIVGLLVGSIMANIVARSFSSLGGIRPGGGIGSSVTSSMTITPVMTPLLAIQAMIFGILVSVIFALYPAWRASKLTPVDALRSE